MTLRDIDFIEIWVEDADATADLYQRTFGFDRIAEAGPETGLAGHRSSVLAQCAANFVVTSSTGPVSRVRLAPWDGVRDVAFTVDDATQAFAT